MTSNQSSARLESLIPLFLAFAVWAMGVAAVGNLALVMHGQVWHESAVAVDEDYFQACAVRGIAVGEVPSPGCHDNKAPVIFLVHQLIVAWAGPFVLSAVKWVALSLVLTLSLLAGMLARALAGAFAGILASALVLLVLATDIHLLSLKTEIVGTVFLLLGLQPVAARLDKASAWRWGVCGLLIGAAVATKQTFALAAFGLLLARLALAWQSKDADRWLVFLKHGVCFGAATALPLAILAALFVARGQSEDFLASLLVYPSVYAAPATDHHIAKALAWRLGKVATDLGNIAVVAALGAAGCMLAILRRHPRAMRESLRSSGLLVAASCVAMLLVTLISPIYFSYHLVPGMVLLAVMAAVSLEELFAASYTSAPAVQVAGAGALVLSGGLLMTTSWYTNGGNAAPDSSAVDPEGRVQRGGGRAYVLGMWPQFYVQNRLVPASSVMFPWALEGTPANWAYRPPDPTTVRGSAMRALQQRNTEKLLLDFRQTPPRYIVVSEAMARAPGSTRITDVQPLDRYIHQNCTYQGKLSRNLGSDQHLFECDVRKEGHQ